jgi:probable HAF family extracellular repeat protein
MKKLFPLWVLSCLLLTLPALAQTHGFYWSPNGGLQDIGTLDPNCSPCNSYARGINKAGQVVGASGFGFLQQPYHAVEWTKTGGMVDLGTLGGPGCSACISFATAINFAGAMVGESNISGPDVPRAVRWSSTGTIAALPRLAGCGNCASIATAINYQGHAVGQVNTAPGVYHAVLWKGGTIQDLGTLGGASCSACVSTATGINTSDEVVGYSTTAAGLFHAFSWTQSGGMQDLNISGASDNAAYGINKTGQIVGEMSNTSSTFAEVWIELGGVHSLASDSVAWAISDANQVVGASGYSGPNQSAELWTGGSQVNIGTGPGKSTVAYGVNVNSEAVGDMAIQ